MKKIVLYISLFISFFVISCNQSNSDSLEKNDSLALKRQKQIDSIIKDVERRKKDRESIKTDTGRNYKKPKVTTFDDAKPQPYNDRKKYYMIVGSFKDYENALKMIEKYEGSQLLDSNSDYKRVSVASFNTLEDAVEAIRQYRSKYPKQPVWLYYE